MTTESDVMAAFKLLAEAIAAEKELQSERTKIERLVNELQTKHGIAIRLVETRREKLASLASVPMAAAKTVVTHGVVTTSAEYRLGVQLTKDQGGPILPMEARPLQNSPPLKTEPLPPARDQKKKVS